MLDIIHVSYHSLDPKNLNVNTGSLRLSALGQGDGCCNEFGFTKRGGGRGVASADERRRRRGAALSIRKCREHSNRKGVFGVAPGSDRHSRRRTVTKHKYERSMRNSPVTESPRYRCEDRRIERSARGIASVRATLAVGSTGNREACRARSISPI